MPQKIEPAISLKFGLPNAVPPTAKAAWGARLIFPGDLLYDRQGFHNWDSPDGDALKNWLNSGGHAVTKALTKARLAGKYGWMTPDGDELVILYRDGAGIVVANPNRSYGYLYVAAWLHNGELALQAPSGTLDLTHRMKGKK